jgi:DsbC/DsbD-like thiol-disulfide interchange protein
MLARPWLLAPAALLAAAAMAQPGDEGPAKARLIAEHTALTPGKANYLGLTFDIDPGWHIYSSALNDSGFPVKIDLTVPAGFKIGKILWPAPTRHIADGDLLDHVYEERVTLLIPVEVPAGASGKVELTGTSEWLVCKQACLPGFADLNLSLPIASQATPSPDAALFAAARERLPKELPKDNPPISWTLDNDVYQITAKGAREVSFYPAADCVKLANPLKDATTKNGTLRLRLADMSLGARLKGVIEIKPEGKDKPRIYAIDLPIADAAALPPR